MCSGLNLWMWWSKRTRLLPLLHQLLHQRLHKRLHKHVPLPVTEAVALGTPTALMAVRTALLRLATAVRVNGLAVVAVMVVVMVQGAHQSVASGGTWTGPHQSHKPKQTVKSPCSNSKCTAVTRQAVTRRRKNHPPQPPSQLQPPLRRLRRLSVRRTLAWMRGSQVIVTPPPSPPVAQHAPQASVDRAPAWRLGCRRWVARAQRHAAPCKVGLTSQTTTRTRTWTMVRLLVARPTRRRRPCETGAARAVDRCVSSRRTAVMTAPPQTTRAMRQPSKRVPTATLMLRTQVHRTLVTLFTLKLRVNNRPLPKLPRLLHPAMSQVVAMKLQRTLPAAMCNRC